MGRHSRKEPHERGREELPGKLFVPRKFSAAEGLSVCVIGGTKYFVDPRGAFRRLDKISIKETPVQVQTVETGDSPT
jgi:hypothetical protein